MRCLLDVGVIEVLTEGLKDKNERVRRRIMATLGELLFYVATQQQVSRRYNKVVHHSICCTDKHIRNCYACLQRSSSAVTALLLTRLWYGQLGLFVLSHSQARPQIYLVMLPSLLQRNLYIASAAAATCRKP